MKLYWILFGLAAVVFALESYQSVATVSPTADSAVQSLESYNPLPFPVYVVLAGLGLLVWWQWGSAKIG